MATLESIAIRVEQAMERLNAAAQQIAAYTGVDAPEVPDWNRSPEELRAEQLEAVAGWAESLAGFVETVTISVPGSDTEPEQTITIVPTIDFTTLTVAELVALIDERALQLPAEGSGAHGALVKQDYIDVLTAAGGAS